MSRVVCRSKMVRHFRTFRKIRIPAQMLQTVVRPTGTAILNIIVIDIPEN